MLGTVGAMAALILTSPEIPSDVVRCIQDRKMWVASPDFFEKTELVQPNGKKEAAYQIRDHHQGSTGYLLVLPGRCRILVIAVSPDGETGLTHSPEGPPTQGELTSLLRFGGYREVVPVAARGDLEIAARSPPDDTRALAVSGGWVLALNLDRIFAFELATGKQKVFNLVSDRRGRCAAHLVPEGLMFPCAA